MGKNQNLNQDDDSIIVLDKKTCFVLLLKWANTAILILKLFD